MALYGRTFGKIAVEAVRRTGAFASGRSYIQRYFPPGYREPATKLVRAFEQAATGAGLYQVTQSLFAPDSPGNDSGIPQKKHVYQTRSPYKTRGGFSRRFSSSNRTRCKSSKGCRCTRTSKY